MGSNDEDPRSKIDKISSLPDELLAQILSLMPTKCAIKTSTLSKAWRFRWTCVTSLDFEFSWYTHPSPRGDDAPRFADFVDRVFQLCSSSQIRIIRLLCPQEGLESARVGAWINEAFRRNVKVLHVLTLDLVLPSSLFMCNTVEELSVGTGMHGDHDITVLPICLPRLKVLKIFWEYPFGDLSEKLFCSCPVLEELYLEAHVSDQSSLEHLTFNISSTTLKKLEMKLYDNREEEERFNFKVIINAPNLESLFVEDDYLPKYIVKNVSSLVKAEVNVGTWLSNSDRERDRGYYERAYELLRALSGVEWLCLSNGTMRCLGVPDAYILPTFQKVTRLEVAIPDPYGRSLLHKIVERSLNMETLSVKM